MAGHHIAQVKTITLCAIRYMVMTLKVAVKISICAIDMKEDSLPPRKGKE